jgi:hypothetical protein
MQKADIYDDKSDILIDLYFLEIYVRQMMIIYIKMFVENHEWHDRSLASLSSFAIFCPMQANGILQSGPFRQNRISMSSSLSA